MKHFLLLLFLIIPALLFAQQKEKYGACMIRNDSVSGINEKERFALHSVMKFPQALYVADYLSRKGVDLDDTIVVDKADLMQDTWSPMRKQGVQNMNDAGITLMPDGSHVIIAVFVTHSPSEAVIANIARQLLKK